MFLKDYYSGNPRAYEIVPKEVLDEIVSRTHEAGYRGVVKPEYITFPYGPDIIRDSQGTWRVIEDNPGFIGGPGDLVLARESLSKHIPEYEPVLKKALGDPRDYYRDLAVQARQRSVPPNGKVIIYSVPPYPDAEDMRLKKLFREQGVEWITPNTKRKLVIKPEGVFVQDGRKLEPVGYIFLNAEFRWADPSFPITREMLLIEEARNHLNDRVLKKAVRDDINRALQPNTATGKIDYFALERSLRRSNRRFSLPALERNGARGLTEAILTGKVASNYHPGVDFIGDKLFYTYVPKMIRTYLGSEPILKNIDTIRMNEPGAKARTFDDGKYKDHVFKPVDGRGGDGVYVGPMIRDEDLPKLEKALESSADRYISQKFTPLSQVDGMIVDTRILSQVHPDSTYVGKAWGRGLPKNGDGKVNLSSMGREFTVIIVPDPEFPRKCVELQMQDAIQSSTPR